MTSSQRDTHLSSSSSSSLKSRRSAMPSFSDSLDRLTLATKSLTSLSQPPTDSAPSFARALLRAPTALLIRDADASEHGLFVVQPGAQLAKTKALSGAPGMGAATTTAAGPAAGGLGRAAFLAATPLRPRPAAVRAQEPKPEVYAAAALKQLDRLCVHAVVSHV